MYAEPQSYEHKILMLTKNDIDSSAIESASRPIAEKLIKMIEFQNGIQSSFSRLGIDVEDRSTSSQKAIHRKTHNRWHQPDISEDEISERFTSDLLNRYRAKSADHSNLAAMVLDDLTRKLIDGNGSSTNFYQDVMIGQG